MDAKRLMAEIFRIPIDEGFIVNSFLETDFYEIPMIQYALKHCRNVQLTMRFINRSIRIKLGKYITEAELRRQLDHAMGLRFGNTSAHYIRGADEYGLRMFGEDVIAFLLNLRLPQYTLVHHGDWFELEFSGLAPEVMLWEIIGMRIVAGLYFRAILKVMSPFERELLFAEGLKRFWQKVKILKARPDVTFTDFSLRRACWTAWQNYLVEKLCELLPPEQFRGSSNVALAQMLDIMPSGTNGHVIQMILAAMAAWDGVEALRQSPHTFYDNWYEMHPGMNLMLPDTFGSKYMIRTISEKNLARYKGIRQDSGPAKVEGDLWINRYKQSSIDPMTKLMVPSNALTVPVMVDLTDYFMGRLNLSHGLGGNLVNDFGDFFPAEWPQMVIKAVRAADRPAVKLSNEQGKASGDPQEVITYMNAFEYEPLVA